MLMGEFLAGMILAVGFCIGKSDGSIEVGQEEQLFLGDYVIERTENITRWVNQAQKHDEPVIRPDRPWAENRALIFGSALYDHDDGIFRMWYYCGGGHVAYWDVCRPYLLMMNYGSTMVVALTVIAPTVITAQDHHPAI